VRSLVTDLGDAYCDELERTAIGPFRLEDAQGERIVPLAEALSFMPEHELSDQEAASIRHGRRIPSPVVSSQHTRLTHEGDVIAIAELREAELQPVVVFAPA
jgi:tRNA pseudouridine55 synthase